MTDEKRLTEALGPVGDVIRNTFQDMGIAEAELIRAKKRWPEPVVDLGRVWPLLRRPALLRDQTLVPRLYRRHVRELLARAARGQDPRLATRAEVLCFLLEASLKAPLEQRSRALTETLFRRVMGPGAWAVLGLDDGSRAREPWTGSSKELLRDLRYRLRDPERKLSLTKSI